MGRKKVYVYIVRCGDNSYYAGVTKDLEKRICEHNTGVFEDCFTVNRRPVELIYQEDCADPLEAIAREKQIQGWSRLKKEALINGNYQQLKKLSMNRQEIVWIKS